MPLSLIYKTFVYLKHTEQCLAYSSCSVYLMTEWRAVNKHISEFPMHRVHNAQIYNILKICLIASSHFAIFSFLHTSFFHLATSLPLLLSPLALCSSQYSLAAHWLPLRKLIFIKQNNRGKEPRISAP